MKLYLFTITFLFATFIGKAFTQVNGREPYFDEGKLIEEIKSNTTTETEEEAEKPKENNVTLISGLAMTGIAFAFFVGFGYKNLSKDKIKANANASDIFSETKSQRIIGASFLPKGEQAPVAVVSLKRQNKADNVVIVQMEGLPSSATPADDSDNITTSNYALANNRAYKVQIPWTPQQSDEIILRRGDLVCVKECYDDGYTLGRNLSTKFDGIFPTVCLARSDDNILGSELIIKGKFTALPKRETSKGKMINKKARRASRGLSLLPNWATSSKMNELNSLLLENK